MQVSRSPVDSTHARASPMFRDLLLVPVVVRAATRVAPGQAEEDVMENVQADNGDRGAPESAMAWKTRDFIVVAALAVPLGIIWSLGWGYVWTFGRSILPELGFVLDGFYVV